MKRKARGTASEEDGPASKEVLLTFVGSHDPDFLSGNTRLDGPIVSLVRQLPYDAVVLLTTPPLRANADGAMARLDECLPSTKVRIEEVALSDPTDHVAILRELRKKLKQLRRLLRDASVSVSVSSGTPQMHACWFLLAASGELPCRILQVRPRQYVTSRRPPVHTIDFMDPEFPRVIPHVRWHVPAPSTPAALMDKVGLVGQSEGFLQTVNEAVRFAKSGLSLLLLGESGVGKELFARLIHEASGREGKFVAFNCTTSTEMLLDSELFGHKKGAFTGAERDRKGLFVEAHKGTLFLDEIGDMPLQLQARLLRVLESKTIRPVGAEQEKNVDVRVVSATNADLREKIRNRTFREDLYHRLNGANVSIPPLRERREDICLIANYLIALANEPNPPALTREALLRLEGYPWPGNIRELRNIIDRALALASGEPTIDAQHIDFDAEPGEQSVLASLPEPHEGFTLKTFLQEIGTTLKQRALELADGNESAAARLLGITPQAMNKFNKTGRGGRVT